MENRPTHACCPDCVAVVNPEHVEIGDDQRQNAVQLRILMCCKPLTAATKWYHAYMLSIVPTLPKCKVVGAARYMRQQSDAWRAEYNEDANEPSFTPTAMLVCQPSVKYVLSAKSSDAKQVAAALPV